MVDTALRVKLVADASGLKKTIDGAMKTGLMVTGGIAAAGFIIKGIKEALAPLIKASPYLESAFNIWKTAFNMFFRPFANFLASILMPLGILLIKFILWMQKSDWGKTLLIISGALLSWKLVNGALKVTGVVAQAVAGATGAGAGAAAGVASGVAGSSIITLVKTALLAIGAGLLVTAVTAVVGSGILLALIPLAIYSAGNWIYNKMKENRFTVPGLEDKGSVSELATETDKTIGVKSITDVMNDAKIAATETGMQMNTVIDTTSSGIQEDLIPNIEEIALAFDGDVGKLVDFKLAWKITMKQMNESSTTYLPAIVTEFTKIKTEANSAKTKVDELQKSIDKLGSTSPTSVISNVISRLVRVKV